MLVMNLRLCKVELAVRLVRFGTRAGTVVSVYRSYLLYVYVCLRMQVNLG